MHCEATKITNPCFVYVVRFVVGADAHGFGCGADTSSTATGTDAADGNTGAAARARTGAAAAERPAWRAAPVAALNPAAKSRSDGSRHEGHAPLAE